MNGACNFVKIDKLFLLVIFAILSTCLLVFSGPGSDGAILGLKLSYKVIIPSLFPFTVCALIIYECIFSLKLKCKSFNRINEILIYIISLFGGFPVGAKLIEKSYANKSISKQNAEYMLSFCVNSGPAFIIIAIGNGILSNVKLGYLLFSANILTSLTFFIFYLLYAPKNKFYSQNIATKSISDTLVSSTYDATQSILLVSAFVVLFSSIISLIKGIFKENIIRNIILSLLEITNGIALTEHNIYFIAFLLGFSGICVHFQVMSMCRVLKPNYLKFLLFRIMHGAINIFYTKELTKIFRISVNTVSTSGVLSFDFSEHSMLFGILFIALSIAFMISINKGHNIL